MTILFWDIDGTLLTTAKGGVAAWNRAVLELTGRTFELASIRIAGLTDYQIAVKTLESLEFSADDTFIRQLVDRYGELLPWSLPQRKGTVLPNVREIFERLRHRPEVRSYLLTGNIRAGAQAKLAHYGLSEHFAGGGFAEDTGERSAIAQRALALARQTGPVRRVFVVGDTPHDIECAKAIDARTIAVATGGYSLEELLAHSPWRAFETLPSPDEFLALIEVNQST